jgi:diaminopimelate decarboxylase
MDVLAQRLPLFPHTTTTRDGSVQIAGLDLGELAATFGTPLYLYDRQTMDAAVEAYRAALAAHYPGPAGITYAGKAFLCTAIAAWTQEQGLWLDCSSEGELTMAAAAQVAPAHLVLHGAAKSAAAQAVVLHQTGVLVIDSLGELERLLAPENAFLGASLPRLWLRLRPGVAADTHAHIQTGQATAKFGLAPAEVRAAVELLAGRGLAAEGLHFHLGSHLHDPAPLIPALETALDLVAGLRAEFGWTPTVLCPGGGWGVAYREDEPPTPPLAHYVRTLAAALTSGCERRGLALPRLQLEPGRSLIAQAGVAVYRVSASKTAAGRRWVIVDGGLADNPRPALYGARYSALPVAQPGRAAVGPTWVGGASCESGDVLIAELPLPELTVGELLAVPVSGAYQLSMSSNYNGARRPAVLLLERGEASLIQRREGWADLLRRDLPLV